MTRRKSRRGKHIPQRTCVGCRLVEPKRSLIRIVRTPDGVQIDHEGKMKGRGAYLHDSRSCWEKGVRGSLAHALKTSLTESDVRRLTEFLQTLPEDSPPGEKLIDNNE